MIKCSYLLVSAIWLSVNWTFIEEKTHICFNFVNTIPIPDSKRETSNRNSININVIQINLLFCGMKCKPHSKLWFLVQIFSLHQSFFLIQLQNQFQQINQNSVSGILISSFNINGIQNYQLNLILTQSIEFYKCSK